MSGRARPTFVAACVAVVAAVLTAIGLSGVGDAPDPHAPPGAIAAWFVDRRADVLHAAPFGYGGALAIVLLAWLVATDLVREGRVVPARVVMGGGVVTAAYLFTAQILWASMAYQVAETSPRDAKTLFVVTIVAVPIFGIGVALLLGGAAVGARDRTMPRWWCWISAAGAVVAATALVGFADSGFFSPDLQQQLVGNILLGWLLLTGATLFVLALRRRARGEGSQGKAVR